MTNKPVRLTEDEKKLIDLIRAFKLDPGKAAELIIKYEYTGNHRYEVLNIFHARLCPTCEGTGIIMEEAEEGPTSTQP